MRVILNVVYLEASDIITDSQRPNLWVPLSSVKEYNQIFNSNYSVESGTAMIVAYDSVGNNGKEIFGDNIQLKDKQQSYSFKKINS